MVLLETLPQRALGMAKLDWQPKRHPLLRGCLKINFQKFLT